MDSVINENRKLLMLTTQKVAHYYNCNSKYVKYSEKSNDVFIKHYCIIDSTYNNIEIIDKSV
jgi:hypothetical protein